MTRIRWWWVGIVGIFMITGALVGCGGGDGDDGDDSCFLFDELPEPNDSTTQFLSDAFFGDCFIVDGSILDALDREDSYGIDVREDLRLVVTLDHSVAVDFDIQIFNVDTGDLIGDCRTNVVPEVCVVAVFAGERVDVVVFSEIGVGTYTLEISAE